MGNAASVRPPTSLSKEILVLAKDDPAVKSSKQVLLTEYNKIVEGKEMDVPGFQNAFNDVKKYFKDRVAKHIELYKDPDALKWIRRNAIGMRDEYNEVYLNQFRKHIKEDPHFTEWQKQAPAVIEKLEASHPKEQWQTGKQSANTVALLYGSAMEILPRYHKFMQQLAESTGAIPMYNDQSKIEKTYHPVSIKKPFRIGEKMCMRLQNVGMCNNIYDVVRGAVVYSIMKGYTQALQFLQQKDEEGVIELMRGKDRMSHDQDGGWRDALFNCRFRDDKSSHIFEIQLHHKEMLVVRKGLGGHATYAKFRGLLESLEVAQKDLEPKNTVPKLQAHVAALEAKKKHAKQNKLYADAKLYSKQLKVAKADLEKAEKLQLELDSALEDSDYEECERLEKEINMLSPRTAAKAREGAEAREEDKALAEAIAREDQAAKARAEAKARKVREEAKAREEALAREEAAAKARAEAEAREGAKARAKAKAREEVTAHDNGFIASDTFAGSKKGYSFRQGEQGLGYYIDSVKQPIDSKDDKPSPPLEMAPAKAREEAKAQLRKLPEKVRAKVEAVLADESTELDLSCDHEETGIGAGGAKPLASCLTGLTQLTKLNLQHNNIGRDGPLAFAACLKGMTQLTELNLSHGGSDSFHDNLAKALAPSLKGLTSLTKLNLGHSDFGDAGVKALARCLKGLTQLTHLYFAGNDIGKGVKKLVPCLEGLTQLTVLDLHGNRIGDPGALALTSCLNGLASLKRLNLTENHISYGCKYELKQEKFWKRKLKL